jgi:hypothetical protein
MSTKEFESLCAPLGVTFRVTEVDDSSVFFEIARAPLPDGDG